MAGYFLTTVTEYYTEGQISIAFCLSTIPHDLSLSQYPKQKYSPPPPTPPPPLEISMAFSHTVPFWMFPGCNYFCLGYLLSDKS
jgi:hypothetical protein